MISWPKLEVIKFVCLCLVMEQIFWWQVLSLCWFQGWFQACFSWFLDCFCWHWLLCSSWKSNMSRGPCSNSCAKVETHPSSAGASCERCSRTAPWVRAGWESGITDSDKEKKTSGTNQSLADPGVPGMKQIVKLCMSSFKPIATPPCRMWQMKWMCQWPPHTEFWRKTWGWAKSVWNSCPKTDRREEQECLWLSRTLTSWRSTPMF